MIPLTSPPDSDPAALPTALRAFQTGLASGRSVGATGTRGPAGAGPNVIVPAAAAAAGLSVQAVGALGTKWPSLRELLHDMATEEGRAAVKDAVVNEEGKEVGDAVVTFWQSEFAMN